MLDIPSPRSLAPWLLAAMLPCQLTAQGSDDSVPDPIEPTRLTLEQAFVEAFEKSPILRSTEAQLATARGRLLAARTFPNNPELELATGDRRGPGSSSTDFGVGLTQELELGGQRVRRTRAAELDVESLEASFLREQRLVAAAVAIVFGEAMAAGNLARLAATETELARELLGITERRFEAGAVTQIDLNLARASTARTERRAEMATASAQEARSLLAEACGLDPVSPPHPVGSLSLPVGEPPSLEDLVAGAIERRADLEALRRSVEAAQARLRLARAERLPDLSVGAFYEEEEGTDRVLGGGLRIRLPFLNRNRGEIEIAEAAIGVSAAKSAARELAVRREVYSAVVQYRAARASAEKLSERVVGNLMESLDLLQRSFSAGKIGLSDLLVLRRELIEARRESIEADTVAWIARIELDLAAGRLPTVAPASFPDLDRQDPRSHN